MATRNLLVNIHGLPRIENFQDLAAQAGVEPQQLWWMLFARKRAYSCYQLPKRTGGVRQIAHPNSVLKGMQRWILRNILDKLHSTSSSYGFDRGSKLRLHAAQHCGAKAILRMDIEDFFPSISIARVVSVFRVSGYSARAASMLAQLCTFGGRLPQGAPSSPKLANLVCFRLDRRLARLSERRGLVYTRYADDMSFSAPSATALAKTKPLITHIVHSSGFRLNTGKTRLLGPRRALIVTGLVVQSVDVGIGRRRLRELRSRICRAQSSVAAVDLPAIQGWLDFVADVDPVRYRMLSRYVEGLRGGSQGSLLEVLRLRSL